MKYEPSQKTAHLGIGSPGGAPESRLTAAGSRADGRGRTAARDGLSLPEGGRFFGPLLSLLFLIYPVRVLLTSDVSPALLALSTAGLALFFGVFLWLFWAGFPPGKEEAGRDPGALKRRAAVGVLAALALVFVLANGYPWLTLFVHTSIAAGMMLRGRDALATIAALAALVAVFGYALGGGFASAGRFLVPLVALGLLCAAFTRQVAAVGELRVAREELARLAVSEERLRFARDLHDLLGHSLSAIALKTALASRLLPDGPGSEQAGREIRDAEDIARGALREVREAVTGYRRPTLAEELDGARGMLEAAGIGCRIEEASGALPVRLDAVLAWAVREGVTNVIRHSGAGRCEIRLGRNADGIEAEIADDGRGSLKRGATGSGLSGLAERVAAEGGALDAHPGADGGFRLRVALPLPGGAAAGHPPDEAVPHSGRST